MYFIVQLIKIIFILGSIFLASFSMAEVTIIQFVEVGPLNLNKNGIVEVLENNNIPYKYYNAQGQASLAKQIINKVISEDDNLIVTITTPVTLLAISSRTNASQPIVFSAVSQPFGAKVIKKDSYLENHITGATDHPPIDKTVEFIDEFFKPKKIGFLYCNSEPNSVESLKELKRLVAGKYEIIEAPITNSGMMKTTVDKLAGQVDLVYVPLDSTVLSSLELATRVLSRHNVPVIANDPDTLAKGVTAAVGFNEYEVGKEAGRKIVRILNAKNNNDDLADLKITSPSKYEIKISKKMVTQFNINVPEKMNQYLIQ